MNNLSIKYFQQELYKVINNCGLPVGVAYFVLKDIINELEKTFNECAYRESQDDNNKEISKSVDISLNEEEMENEGTNTDASEHSGSTNDN